MYTYWMRKMTFIANSGGVPNEMEQLNAGYREERYAEDPNFTRFSSWNGGNPVGQFEYLSVIKNPGGGLAPIGGYICGTKECVDRCAYRLSAPGLGQEVGANLGLMPALYQGLFLSPTVVSGALKGAVFAANIYEKLGFACVPNATESRHDIIQAVTLGSAEAMVAFCKGIQAAAPVDSYVTPEPWAMPGYDSDVIMAAGAFVQGSSIELSADGPIRPPYAVYFQGGLTWYHAKLGILMSLQKLVEAGLVTLPESK